MKQIKLENTENNLELLQKLNIKIAQDFWKLDHSHSSNKYADIQINEDKTHIRLLLNEKKNPNPLQCLTDECPDVEEATDEGWVKIPKTNI